MAPFQYDIFNFKNITTKTCFFWMNLGWGILLLFCSHIGLFDLLICLHPGEFASFVKKKKCLCPGLIWLIWGRWLRQRPWIWNLQISPENNLSGREISTTNSTNDFRTEHEHSRFSLKYLAEFTRPRTVTTHVTHAFHALHSGNLVSVRSLLRKRGETSG